MQKYFYDRVYVNSCPLFPVPCSLFPTSARSLLLKRTAWVAWESQSPTLNLAEKVRQKKDRTPNTQDAIALSGS
ncbi:hypothetical protein BJP36_40580 [Moorena producens JHB]|uniref:Uncharacterized protein n=1 Tax=Moorena producens (strain JHB) TaxID=1454205 RepID=A0A9Q9SS87_MOOP1|nr:hypothetical protein [Moorena producens]WAN68668.1 hypothetical protein BJP36_40580 [Moorena producens JHB]